MRNPHASKSNSLHGKTFQIHYFLIVIVLLLLTASNASAINEDAVSAAPTPAASPAPIIPGNSLGIIVIPIYGEDIAPKYFIFDLATREIKPVAAKEDVVEGISENGQLALLSRLNKNKTLSFLIKNLNDNSIEEIGSLPSENVVHANSQLYWNEKENIVAVIYQEDGIPNIYINNLQTKEFIPFTNNSNTWYPIDSEFPFYQPIHMVKKGMIWFDWNPGKTNGLIKYKEFNGNETLVGESLFCKCASYDANVLLCEDWNTGQEVSLIMQNLEDNSTIDIFGPNSPNEKFRQLYSDYSKDPDLNADPYSCEISDNGQMFYVRLEFSKTQSQGLPIVHQAIMSKEGEILYTIPDDQFTFTTQGMDWSPDSRYFAYTATYIKETGFYGDTIKIYDTQTRKVIFSQLLDFFDQELTSNTSYHVSLKFLAQ